jgi:uncharacterized membrane protein YqjE
VVVELPEEQVVGLADLMLVLVMLQQDLLALMVAVVEVVQDLNHYLEVTVVPVSFLLLILHKYSKIYSYNIQRKRNGTLC